MLCAGLCLTLCAGILLSLAGPGPAGLLPGPPWPTGAPAVARSDSEPVRCAAEPTAGELVATFQWPLAGTPQVVRRFAAPAQPWLAGHRGVDGAAAPKAVVRAAAAGEVRFADWLAGRPVISVDHANGLRTTYERVDPAVRAGDLVSRGDPLGRLLPGHPGCPVAACLHWGLRRGDMYLDPLIVLGSGQVRLLPLTNPAAAAT